MDKEEARRRLKKRNIAECARDTGLRYQRLMFFASGHTQNPSSKFLETVIYWLQEN